MEKQTFAEQLVAARKAAGLTQEQLGEKLHMSRQGISHWETGRALPDVESLRQLSQVLGYDFITSQALEEPGGADAAKEAVPPAPAPAQPVWKQPVLWLSIAVALLSVLLLWIVLWGHTSPAGNEAFPTQLTEGTAAPAATGAPAERAEVRIIPAQNPITPSIDPVLGSSPWWIYRLTIQEVNGVDFTIEKMTTTYRYTDGATQVIEQGAQSVAAGSNTGSNVLRRGVNLYWNGAQPLTNYEAITVRLDGTDALGNVLAFECVIDCVMPEETP